MLARALAAHDPLVVREPGGTELGERIRDLLLHRPEAMAAIAEMYLFMAARAELLEERIKPALAAGRLELRGYLREQTISRIVHRYGSVMQPAPEGRP